MSGFFFTLCLLHKAFAYLNGTKIQRQISAILRNTKL